MTVGLGTRHFVAREVVKNQLPLSLALIVHWTGTKRTSPQVLPWDLSSRLCSAFTPSDTRPEPINRVFAPYALTMETRFAGKSIAPAAFGPGSEG
jgi:hypothetical protein